MNAIETARADLASFDRTAPDEYSQELCIALAGSVRALLRETAGTPEALPPEVIAFDDFLNEPPEYEDKRYVREFRHDAYPRWQRALDAMKRLAAAPPAAVPGIPAGYALVPIEPTMPMIQAGAEHAIRVDEDEDKYRARGQAIAIYKDMIAAAPAAPTKEPK